MIGARHYAAFTAACLAALSGCATTDHSAARAARQILPAPAHLAFEPGALTVTNGTRVVAVDPRAQPVARQLIDLVARTRGLEFELADDPTQGGAIRLVLRDSVDESPDGYELSISPQGAEIVAAHPQGLFYGAVTLWQLLTADAADSGAATVAALRIVDAPRFRWRGLMLDSARHYQPPTFIRQLIDWMALHKLNVLHWHLTDDQGWRLEIRKHPRLTEVGAWRIPAGAAWPRDPDPATGMAPRYGGYYTQQEVREIVAYAASRFVTIVPEIEMPGHAQAAIAAYPELGTGGTPPPVSSDWGVHDYLFNADESTMRFLEDVLTEVIELFPGEYIHVGGDEAVKTRWQRSAQVQARIRELGLADESALQGWFVARIENFLGQHGRRLIGWDEIVESGLPARATVMSWRGTAGAVEAARAGHDVVMAPAPVLYLDHLQSDSPAEPPGRPRQVTLEDVYRFEPVPPEIAADQERHILGAQLNAWTEHMRLPTRVAYQAFPRVAALAEVTWSPRATRNWQDFLDRLPVQFARYRKLGIPFAATAFEPRPRVAPGATPGHWQVALSNQTEFGQIRYTLDGTEPSAASTEYHAAFEAGSGAMLRAASFAGELPLASAPALPLDARALRRRTDQELRPCSGKLVLRLEDDAPLEGARAFFNVDIIDPCWIWPGADLTGVATLRASVGQVPFNFQIGAAADTIRRGDARSAAGELEVRLDGCNGEPVAVIPLAPAAGRNAVMVLPVAELPSTAGHHDLCLRFARPAIDPIWTIEWVELGE
jgi:hexosaminidase